MVDTSSFRTYLYLVFYGFITGSYLTLFERLFHNGFIPNLPITTPIPLRYHSELLPNLYRRNSEETPKERSTLSYAHARVPYIYTI